MHRLHNVLTLAVFLGATRLQHEYQEGVGIFADLAAFVTLMKHWSQRAVRTTANGLVFQSIDAKLQRFSPSLRELWFLASCPIPLDTADARRLKTQEK